MNGWKGARLGRLGICCVKKKNVLWKYTLLFDTSFFFFFFCWLVGFCFCFFKFYFFLPSQTWMLGFSLGRLQKILCLVFCLFVAFFFFFSVFFFYFFFSFVLICFFQNVLDFFFFPKSPILEFACWDSLESFSPDFVVVFCFCCCLFLNCFMFKIQFRKRRTSTVRFHSSEFSVSIMHSSLLS